LPAGNLGNTSAFGKALEELRQLGLIEKMPRLACVQAAGANPFYLSYQDGFRERRQVAAHTLATAIRIGNPVSHERAVRALRWTNGLVTQATDQEIMDAKAAIDAAGIGCEPASASSLAGIRKLVAEGVIGRGESVVAVLTGHLLKDPEATIAYHLGQLEGIRSESLAAPLVVDATLDAVEKVLGA
jgi:threonine synthase